MTSEGCIDRVSRLVDVIGRNLVIYEHTEMDNEAGAVVWDAALVLLNYFCQGTSLAPPRVRKFAKYATVHVCRSQSGQKQASDRVGGWHWHCWLDSGHFGGSSGYHRYGLLTALTTARWCLMLE